LREEFEKMENNEGKSALSESPAVVDELDKRKKQIMKFLKEKASLVYTLVLSFIIFVGLYIRTRNIPKLKDITTGTWTLGPDLDPFLFLRWAQYIAKNGKLFLLDTMRSVPLAEFCSGTQCIPVNTAGEMNLLSYLIAWLYKFMSFFSETSVTYAAIIFPVIMFGLTAVAFFFFARKIFYKKDAKARNIIAIISTAFFVLIPSLLPRTIAGIPEKESAAFFFIFMGFYLFLEAFTSEKLKKGLIFGFLAGVSTGILALLWGGVTYVIMTIAGAVLFAFILGKIDKKRFYAYGAWILGFLVLMLPFSTRYTPVSLVTSTSTGLAFLALFIISVDFMIFKKKILHLDEKIKLKLPNPIISLIITFGILVILSSIMFGVSFIPDTVKDVIEHTVHPFVPSRFGITVAENRMPYFVSEWKGDFGPVILDIPLYFWLFFIGSVILFSSLISRLEKKEKGILTVSYIIFLFCLVFSRYSPSSILNGESNISLMLYFAGFLFFLGSFGYFYYKRYKENKMSGFREFEFSYILYFAVLTMTIIGARGAVRLIMVLGAVTPIVVGFLIFSVSESYLKEKNEARKFFFGIVALLIIVASIFTVWTYYKTDKAVAENYAPGIYQWQWQKAMQWVRENTSQDAVFAHWWDYGYWVQSIGERATILDGGNALGYWNHLMGRHVLTGPDEMKALEFLYAHNGTHLLIDSSDIGKYTAFSSIGSDGSYDRYSWITTFLKDERQTQETNNMTFYVYTGGNIIDDDIVWKEGENEIFLPRKSAAIGAIIVSTDSAGKFLQPEGVFIYKGAQYRIPLRYLYVDEELLDFKTGVESGVFLFQELQQTTSGLSIDETGAALYLGKRTIHSGVARLYLMNLQSQYFKLAHTENDLLITDLRNQGVAADEFIYYQGLRGPIKIWEITYPAGMKLNPEFLSTDYPEEFQKVLPGEY
jgi:asparagine N-glycosylation enzyme membrane subunit Stt3